MATKLNSNFMAELFKLIYLDPVMTRIATTNLTYSLIPKEWAGYKFLLKEAVEVYTSKETVPSLGVVAQKYVDNDFVQNAIKAVQDANKVDKEIIIDQLEAYIKDVEFQLLSTKVHDLYEADKKEEAIKVNAEESQRILSISLRHEGGAFQKVFKGFETRQRHRVDTEDEKQQQITLGLDKLDDLSYGGGTRGDTVLWIARSGTGKALSLDSDIMTPTGIIKMKNIKVGDEILGSDGKPQKVIGVYPQGFLKCYKITFNDGTTVKCNDKHLWKIANVRNKKRWEVVELSELMKRDLKTPHFHNGEKYTTQTGNIRYGMKGRLKWLIPNQQISQFEEKELLIDPYTMGVMLGDGSFSKGYIAIASRDEEILSRLKFPESQYLISYEKTDQVNFNIRKGKSVHSIDWYLDQYNLLNKHADEKFIPKDYLFNTFENRIEILRGILDTDGYVDEKGIIELALTSKQLIEDVAFLSRSLGCFCHKISKMKSGYKNKKGEYIKCKDHYRLRIVPPRGMNLFHLTRKSERSIQDKKKYCIDRKIESIEYVGIEEMQCIEVSNEDGLFMTNNFVITHNSTVLRHIGVRAALNGFSVLHIQLEGTVQSCLDKYDQYWTGLSFSHIKTNSLSEEEKKKVEKSLEQILAYANDIDVYGFEKFGEATMIDVRNLILDYHKSNGHFPDVLILDSLDLVGSGINKIIDNNPAYKKDKLQTCAQLLKNLCIEFNMLGVTATQASNVPIEIWDNDEKVIDRSYTEGDKTLVKPFSFVMTCNQTIEESKNKEMRIFVDKIRDYKGTQEVFKIVTDYDKARFCNMRETRELYGNQSSVRKSKKETESRLVKGRKINSKTSKAETV